METENTGLPTFDYKIPSKFHIYHLEYCSDNQGQKKLTHLFKMGAFIKHLIHLLFHPF